MRVARFVSLALGLSLVCACHSSSQHPETADGRARHAMQDKGIPHGIEHAPGSASVGLCNTGEEVLFSCNLPSQRRQVAFCARGSSLTYRYGLPGRVEMTYPAQGETAVFHRNPVMLAGANGGYVYAFHNKGLIHAIAKIGDTDAEGTASLGVFTTGGVRINNAECDPASIHESDDVRLLRTVSAWPKMQGLSANGIGIRIGR